ncbi:serine/threonine protein kinase, partial [Pseudonocardia abyssalis]|uniref:serine/threonine protein kinase n=1 Tax=Pseudonocardia abyssalis TaxID=2792008 RepID=UPI001C49D5ED
QVVHAGGFVHRDVKPANVLLDSGGRPLLADFGVAWTIDGATATTAGAVVGTAAYMSPEQVGGHDVGPATDVYALGLVLIEALTGRREYPGSAVESAVARLSRSPRVPGGLPPILGSTIEAMTRTDPSRRPGAAEVATMLSDTPTSTVGLRAPALRAGHSRSRRGLLAAATCVVGPLLVLGAAGSSVTTWVPTPPVVESAAPAEVAPPPTGSAVPTGSVMGRQDAAAPIGAPLPSGAGPSEVSVAPDTSVSVGSAARSPDAVSVDAATGGPVGDTDELDGGTGGDELSEDEAVRPGNDRGPGNGGRGRDHQVGPPEHAND